VDEQQPIPNARQRLLDETEAAIARFRSKPGDENSPEGTPDLRAVDNSPARESAPNANPAEITVELPHGQSLTVRGLDPGAIVEIASWTGTGPPDADAVRMMFGATRPPATRSGEATPGKTSPRENDDASSSEGSEQTESETTEGESNNRKARTMWKRLGITAGVILLIAGIVAGLRLTGIAYFEHPDGGLTGGLGSAESTFVAISPGAAIESNASVLVAVDGENLVAGVIEVGADEVLIFTGDGQQVVTSDDVLGRVLFVVPFIGYLAG